MNNKTNKMPEIEDLKIPINNLIEEYKRTDTLLNDQMQAVINQDIESLNELIEKQVAAFESLKESENEFKQELQNYHSVTNGKQKTSLSSILENLNQPSKTLNTLRDKLRAQATQTEMMRSQLMDLLQFAQQHNAEIFKALCTVGQEYVKAYDGEGQKQQRQVSGLAINQKA